MTITITNGVNFSGGMTFSSFIPSDLFAVNSTGAWYEPANITTMWRDHQGVTPVTDTGQSVGLILDQSIGTRTQVFNDANVSFSNLTYANRISPGVYQYARDNSGLGQVSFGGLTAGQSYLVSLQISAYTGPVSGITGNRADYISGLNATLRPFTNTAGVYTFYYLADSGSFGIRAGGPGNGGTISNVSIIAVPGNHATQPTAGSRPIYGIEPFGGRRNLFTFTEQFDNAAWSKGVSTISPNLVEAPDGQMTADGIVESSTSGDQGLLRSLTDTGTNTFYFYAKKGSRDFFTMYWFSGQNGASARLTVNLNTGAVTQWVVNQSQGNNYSYSVTPAPNGYWRISGTYTRVTGVFPSRVWFGASPTGTASGENNSYLGNGSTAIYLWGAQLETGSSVTPYQRVTDQWNVTEAGVPSVSYLAFDGTDDFLQTSTITPNINQAQVFAGLRKLSDAATGAVVGMSTAPFGNNGTIELYAPLYGNGYGYASRGTSNIDVSPQGFPAPTTNVVTGISEISTDTNILRVNGSQVGSANLDQGTGNYLAYPLYIGRRGGANTPFNGRIYSLIVRFGANLPLATIQQTEEWVNSKTGAYQ